MPPASWWQVGGVQTTIGYPSTGDCHVASGCRGSRDYNKEARGCQILCCTHAQLTPFPPTSPPVLGVPALWKLNEQLRHAGRMGCAMRYQTMYTEPKYPKACPNTTYAPSTLVGGGGETPECVYTYGRNARAAVRPMFYPVCFVAGFVRTRPARRAESSSRVSCVLLGGETRQGFIRRGGYPSAATHSPVSSWRTVGYVTPASQPQSVADVRHTCCTLLLWDAGGSGKAADGQSHERAESITKGRRGVVISPV